MPGRRRGEQRAHAQATRTGLSIREARLVSGLTRRAAATRAGLARSTWDRIERGSTGVTLANLVAASDAVGLDLVCHTYPGRPPGLRDSGQLVIAQFLRELAHASWRVSLEEPAGDHGEAIDMVFWGPMEIIAVEIERRLIDWQSQSRRWSTKRAWIAARHARPVRLVIVVTDTPRNRGAVHPFSDLIGRTLPAGSRSVIQALRTGAALDEDGLCWVRERRMGAR
jgi:transcriptional regulator with XRE-family HTH domain